jgi:hypothetical protein
VGSNPTRSTFINLVEGNNTDESEGKKDELQKEQDLAFLRKRAILIHSLRLWNLH